MNLLNAVIIGHLIGDWIIQTDFQVANKMNSWKANQQHMLGYHLCLFLICLLAASLNVVLMLIFVSWVTHSFIDRRWPVVRLMEITQSRPFSKTTFGVVAVDQSLHLSILIFLAGVL